MFYKISGIEGAQSFSFTNTDTSYEQKLKLYDEEVNVIVDANSDKLAYIFDAEKTYYLYAYSEAVGESDTTTAIRCEEVDFYAVADGDAEVEVLYNAEHTMRVTAMTEAGELSYQWYYLDENGDDSIINVETNDTLTITANEDAHRNYLCKVSNGDETVDVCFVINIDTGLKTTIIPYNYVLVNYGETKVLTVDASSNASNITYQWYYSDSDTSEGGMIAGATGNNYTLTGNANLKYSYYCKVSDGINTVKTKKVYPELDTGLRVLNGDYMELKAQYGDKVEIEIEAVSTRPNITYKWYQCVDSDESNLELISTNSTSTYSYIASGSSYNYYKCVVSDGVMTKVVYIYVDYSGRIEDIAENFSATLEYSSIVEDGTAKKPIVTVRNDESTLEIDRHYTVEYKNNVKPGTATVVIKGIGRYKGEITKTFTITAKPATKPTQPTNPTQPTLTSISKATVTLSKKSYVFDGKAKKPSVKVVFNGKTLVKGTDYTVAYTKNKQIGKATVKVTGKGKYTGTVTKTFNINIKVGKTYTVGAYKYKVTSKSEVAFAGLKKANTKNVVIAGTVKIGGKKFKITSIVNNALKKKIKVKSVTIGANVKKIGKNAFSGCKNLKTITIKSTKLKSVGKNAFKGINSKAKIKVPKKKYNAYKKLLKAKGQPKNVKITK
ncbi:MAG: leucine-rich repeat protein [Lachnospiraceae bacterium]|nr:leucine-rich repeat protein [Lachnospiraceae bacterium]